jgi:tetratricopeptide (TPR) repeat protein
VAPQADLSSVPFFAQKEYECGPAALAMVMAAAGVVVKPEELVEQVYLPARKGSLQVEMLAATRQRGLVAYPLKPALQDLLAEVAAGHPVLVFQNVSLPIYPVWHYAVVIGYDLDRNTITLHSGETERMELSLFTFERIWARGSYWAMLALAPDQLPATAELQTLARSLAALEASHPGAAAVAYGTALARWPQQATLLFGLGNSRYALKDLAGAQAAYLQATQAQPDFADAWNNLAQVQWELGQGAQARAAIARAVALGGARLPQYLELQLQMGSPLRE